MCTVLSFGCVHVYFLRSTYHVSRCCLLQGRCLSSSSITRSTLSTMPGSALGSVHHESHHTFCTAYLVRINCTDHSRHLVLHWMLCERYEQRIIQLHTSEALPQVHIFPEKIGRRQTGFEFRIIEVERNADHYTTVSADWSSIANIMSKHAVGIPKHGGAEKVMPCRKHTNECLFKAILHMLECA